MVNRRDFFNIPINKLKTIVSDIKNPEKDKEINVNILNSDFTDEMLFMEIMKLGMDPASLSKKQMLEIIYKKLSTNSLNKN